MALALDYSVEAAPDYNEAISDCDEEEREFSEIGERLIRDLEKLELPYEDGIPMESNWHRLQMNLLIDVVEQHWQDRNDFFVGGNMFIYFSMIQAKNNDYRGPDFFVVKNTRLDRSRKSWVLWEEDGKYPHIIIELLSPTTLEIDLGEKKELYAKTFRTPEYFCYDPQRKKLYGWRLNNGEYAEIPATENGWLESRQLGVWIGLWEGEHHRLNTIWVRFYTPDGQLVPSVAEAEAQRANTEAERARQAEAELQRLRGLLAARGIDVQEASVDKLEG